MSADQVNILRNPRFEKGARFPQNWTWEMLRPEASWSYEPGRAGNADRSVCLQCHSTHGAGRIFQRVKCAGEQYYRIEAIVRCDLQPGCDANGLRMLYRPVPRNGAAQEPTGPQSWRRAGTWSVMRDYYETPKDTRELEIEFRLDGAVGRAWVDEVRVIPIEDVERDSHPLAVPPPPCGYPAAKRVRTIACLTAGQRTHTLETVLKGRFGNSAVRVGTPADFDVAKDMDAVILQADRWPSRRPSWQQLLTRAENQLVIIGLELFADIVNRGPTRPVLLRVNEQPDDPIHATVMHANFLTRGFALLDVIPWRSEDQEAGTFVQRFIRNTAEFKAFCKHHQLVTILQSEGDKDATSGHPVCLYHESEDPKARGGLVVMDLDPMESAGGCEDAKNIIAFVLFNALGAKQSSIGQYVVPARTLEGLDEIFQDMHQWYPDVVVDTLEPAPAYGPRWQVTLGRQADPLALTSHRQPAILLRTGFSSEDWAGVYGAWLWLKQLVRPEPYRSRYLSTLAAQHRLVWFPVVRPDTWLSETCSSAAAQPEMETDFSEGEVALALDVTASADQSLNVLLPSSDDRYAAFASRLPGLDKALARNRFYCCGPAIGSTDRDRDSYRWRWEDADLSVRVEPDQFRHPYYQAAIAVGGLAVRLELPGGMDLSGGHSIWRTERAALFVEWIVGTLLGVVAVNRDETSCRIDLGTWPEPNAQMTVIDLDGQTARTRSIERGARAAVNLSPGQTWLLCR